MIKAVPNTITGPAREGLTIQMQHELVSHFEKKYPLICYLSFNTNYVKLE